MADVLSKTDRLLLDALMENARVPLTTLASKLRIPRSTLKEHLRRLEREKVIRGYTVVRNHEALNESMTAFVMVQIGANPAQSLTEYAKRIGRLPLVEEVHVITGEWDIMVKIRGADMKSIYKTAQALDPETGYGRTLTILAFETTKEPV